MTKRDWKLTGWVVGFLVLASGITNCGGKQTPPPACTASQSEQCPSADFLKDYDGWQALKSDINEIGKKDNLQQKQDTLTGWANRLNQQIPPGYTFNETSRKFEKRVVPLPPPAPEVKK